MSKSILVFTIILFASAAVFAQGWSPWEALYDDAKISVEVQFKMYSNSCEGGKQCKYRYRLSPGTARPNPYFVTWKMDYVDCDGNMKFEQNSVNIGQGATLNAMDESMDYTFRCSSMVTPVYDVELSGRKIQTSGRRIIPLSQPATEITSRDTLYQGESLTLRVKGGILGAGANWVWYKTSCEGEEIGRGDSIQVSPTKSTTFFVRAEGTNNITACVSKKVRVFRNFITGKQELFRGESETLKVAGARLRQGLQWIWYKDECEGTPIMFGDTLTISPLESSTYYAKLDGVVDGIDCVAKKVIVSKKSSKPGRIVGESKMCEGETSVLSVLGGYLGEQAKWVWYEGSCGGKKVGEGESVSVSPKINTSYFVMGEGKYNKTDCVSFSVDVLKGSIVPDNITGKFTICEGEGTTLRIIGGSLGSNAEWRWYHGSCNGVLVGTGREITISPKSTGQYYVRAEGDCNTACINCEVVVKTKSRQPFSITKSPSDVLKNKEFKLSTIGGKLGTGAEWMWYSNSCDDGKSIGSGESVFVKTNSETTFFVKSSGDCNETDCKSLTVIPRKIHRFDPVFTNKTDDKYNNKFLHIGGGGGLELVNFKSSNSSSIIGTFSNAPIDSTLQLTGIGIKGEFILHPYISDYFSVGIFTGGALGTTTGFLESTQSGYKKNETYLYSRLNAGLELAAGSKPFKVLLAYRIGFHTHDFTYTLENSFPTQSARRNVQFQLRRESLMGGFRIASYSREKRKSKRGVNFDIAYHLVRDYPWDWSAATWSYSGGTNWRHGGSFTMWIHSVLKLNLEMTFAQLGSDNADGLHYSISLIYNRNSFY